MDEDLDRRLAETPAPEDEYIQSLRRELLANLPGLIGKAIRGYERFTANPAPDDAKGFVAYQAGCRAALAHIHLLVKLAHWARPSDVEAAPPFDGAQLDRLVREAEAALGDDFIDEG